jgi:hypothetical protein
MLERVGDAEWAALSAEGGDGVTFAELVRFAGAAAEASGLEGGAEAWKPADDGPETRAALAALLAGNEESAEDALLVYYNQGVVTGDWDGPHVAVIGAHDAATGRVLILEVDQEWYVPYWTSEETLLAAMLKPTSIAHGPLAGETGGLVRLRRAAAG